MMSFADRLREARQAAGYTQQQVADLMGITGSTYCGYETGKRQPDPKKIKTLAQLLNTSGDFLLETGFDTTPTTEQKNPPAESQEDEVEATAHRLLDALKQSGVYDKITPQQLEKAVRVLCIMLDGQD